MAEPKKRLSITRSRNRRRWQKLAATTVSSCPHCHQSVAAHRVCPHCVTAQHDQRSHEA